MGRLPIYLEASDDPAALWGFVCITIDVAQCLSQTNLDSLKRQGYAYELWRMLPTTNDRQTIACSEVPISADPEECEIFVPNSTWIFSLTPEDGWRNQKTYILEWALAALFALLCAFLVGNGCRLAFNRRELQTSLRQQSANYQMLNDLNQDLHTFRHDITNHMLCLTSLLESKEYRPAQEYIRTFMEQISKPLILVNTENYVFDALLSYKLEAARQRGIRTDRK